MDVIDWLLDSDPAIRWQVLRDLTDASPDEVISAVDFGAAEPVVLNSDRGGWTIDPIDGTKGFLGPSPLLAARPLTRRRFPLAQPGHDESACGRGHLALSRGLVSGPS